MRTRQLKPGMLPGLLIAGLLAGAVLVLTPATSQAASISVGISVGIAPPPIPVYVQPPCPAPGYIWTPGYWAYDPRDGYFWVPGTWVASPEPGFLWTPGYWGWGGSAFFWHAGYWGPHVGFYGGINYGFGYNGVGFVGGEWRGRNFYYNRAVNNFGDRHFDNVYDHPVRNNFAVNRVSYNGGEGGLRDRPGRGELAAEHERHMDANSMQHQHEMTAHNDRAQFASVNHGRPEVAATGRPGDFGHGTVGASRAGGPFNDAHYQGSSQNHPSGYSGGHGSNPRPASQGSNPNFHSSYSGGRSSNPEGGGNHQVMTTPQNSPASRNYGQRQGVTPSSQYHSQGTSHNQGPHGAASNPQPMFHQAQSPERSSHGSGGGTPQGAGGSHGGGGTHGSGAPQHEERPQHGGEPHHR